MARHSAIYIRLNDQSLDAARSNEFLPSNASLLTEPNRDYGQVIWPTLRAPDELLCSLSLKLQTDLACSSVDKAFAFQHWHDGICTRTLDFGSFRDQQTWHSIGGSAEKWEQRVYEVFARQAQPLLDSCAIADVIGDFYNLPGF